MSKKTHKTEKITYMTELEQEIVEDALDVMWAPFIDFFSNSDDFQFISGGNN